MTIWVTAPQTAERNQGHGCQWGGMQIHVRALPSCFPIPLPPIDSWTTPRKLWVGSSNPLQIILFKWYLCYSQSHSVMSNYLQPHGLYSPRNSPGQNTGVDCHFLLQGPEKKDVLRWKGGQHTMEEGRADELPDVSNVKQFEQQNWMKAWIIK